MTKFTVHTVDTAPLKSKPALEGLRQSLGFIPNLAATMAESPPLIHGFVSVFGLFHGGSFHGAEKQVLLLTNAVTNHCAWAVAFHSTAALKEGVDPEDVRAIREGRLPNAPRLAALSAFTRALIDRRGAAGAGAIEAFTAAGFGRDQVLEVIAGLAVSTLANYAGNITDPPLEAPFQAQAWTG